MFVLHEIGHIGKDFTPHLNEPWRPLYERALAGLNLQQREEMRADAFAAATLRKACYESTPSTAQAASIGCYAIVLHAPQVFIYSLFDKSPQGKRREYLDLVASHPNSLMRLLAMSVLLTNEAPVFLNLLDDFLSTRL